jgi:hypothetical protein
MTIIEEMQMEKDLIVTLPSIAEEELLRRVCGEGGENEKNEKNVKKEKKESGGKSSSSKSSFPAAAAVITIDFLLTECRIATIVDHRRRSSVKRESNLW